MKPIIYIENGTYSYDIGDHESWRININDFKIYPRTIILVQGNNMSGKSTFLNILSGMLFDKNYRGDFIINGIQANDNQSIRNLSTLISNSDAMFPELSIWENIQIAIPPKKQVNLAEKKDKCALLIKNSDIFDKKDINMPLGDFSTGAKSFVKLCRAYAASTDIVIIDELTSYLDDIRAYYFLDTILELVKCDSAVVLVSHSMRDRMYIKEQMLNLSAEVTCVNIVRASNSSTLSYEK